MQTLKLLASLLRSVGIGRSIVLFQSDFRVASDCPGGIVQDSGSAPKIRLAS